LIVNVSGPVPVPPLLVALSVTVQTPAPLGVPEIKPEAVFTVRPAGNPDAPKLVGKLAAIIWYENALPTVPFAVAALVITGAAVTVTVSVAVPVPPLLVALNVTVETPAPLGVPEIKPVVVLTDNPLGNPVAP
jgi:hypothetical protein